MPRPKKSIEDTFYDVFASWAIDDQRAALKVLEQLHRQKVRDAGRATKQTATQHFSELPLMGGAYGKDGQ